MSPLNIHSSTSAAKRARALFTVVAVTVWLMLEALTAPVAQAAVPGDLDTSFGGDGKVTLDIFLGSDEFGSAAAIQSDGKIVVAGTYAGFSNNNDVFALARFNPNGSVDTSFGSGGRTLTAFPNTYWSAEANAVAIQPDGKIVAAGERTSLEHGIFSDYWEKDFALARYNTNGSLDTTFGGDGKVDTSIVNENLSAYGVAIQSDGKIVAAGQVAANTDADFETIRYNTNGTPDTSFDGNGLQATGFGGWDAARAVAIQPDGKIVAVGSTSAGAGSASDKAAYDFALARYHA